MVRDLVVINQLISKGTFFEKHSGCTFSLSLWVPMIPSDDEESCCWEGKDIRNTEPSPVVMVIEWGSFIWMVPVES